MANSRRKRSKQLHFSDGQGRFATRSARPRRDDQPLSPSFSRKVMRCKRCGSRVVSNVDHCPYCGKNLRPIFMRLWFWLIVVAALALLTAFIVINSIPEPEPVQPTRSSTPVVVGADSGSSFKDIKIGTTVDVDSLLITVTAVADGPVVTDGSVIKLITVQFSNKRSDPTTLFSTQWQVEKSDGSRDDTYIGTSTENTSIASNFEAYELAPGKQFTGLLYFSGNDLAKAVYSPNALSYSETDLVTWLFPQKTE